MIFINPWAFYHPDDIPDLTPQDDEEMVGCLACACGYIVSTIIYVLLAYLCFTFTKSPLSQILFLMDSAVIYPIIMIYLVNLSSKIGDKILKKEKVPKKAYKEENLLKYKDKKITLEDGDEIFDIYINTLDYKSSRTSEFEKNAFKQGLFDYAWCNYSREVDNKFRFNEFGDDFADQGYSRANNESGYEWDEVGVGMMFMEPFFWGWECAKKLNLKYNSIIKVKFPLNRFVK